LIKKNIVDVLLTSDLAPKSRDDAKRLVSDAFALREIRVTNRILTHYSKYLFSDARVPVEHAPAEPVPISVPLVPDVLCLDPQVKTQLQLLQPSKNLKSMILDVLVNNIPSPSSPGEAKSLVIEAFNLLHIHDPDHYALYAKRLITRIEKAPSQRVQPSALPSSVLSALQALDPRSRTIKAEIKSVLLKSLPPPRDRDEASVRMTDAFKVLSVPKEKLSEYSVRYFNESRSGLTSEMPPDPSMSSSSSSLSLSPPSCSVLPPSLCATLSSLPSKNLKAAIVRHIADSYPPKSYDEAKSYISEAFHICNISDESHLATYVKRLLDIVKVPYAPRYSSSKLLDSFCAKLRNNANWTLFRSYSTNEERKTALFASYTSHLLSHGITTRFLHRSTKQHLWSSFCSGIKSSQCHSRCVNNPISQRRIVTFSSRLLKHLRKSPCDFSDCLSLWRQWCQKVRCWDSDMVAHVRNVRDSYHVMTDKSRPPPLQTHSIKIASSNVVSIHSHMSALIENHSDVAIWAIQEICSPKPPPLPRGWRTILNPRASTGRAAGGTGFAIDSNRVSFAHLHHLDHVAHGSVTEWLWIRVDATPPLFIASVYSPPDDQSPDISLWNQVDSFLSSGDVLLLGDLNTDLFRHHHRGLKRASFWSLGVASRNGRILNAQQPDPTYQRSTLDYALFIPHCVSTLPPSPGLPFSLRRSGLDHKMLVVNVPSKDLTSDFVPKPRYSRLNSREKRLDVTDVWVAHLERDPVPCCATFDEFIAWVTKECSKLLGRTSPPRAYHFHSLPYWSSELSRLANGARAERKGFNAALRRGKFAFAAVLKAKWRSVAHNFQRAVARARIDYFNELHSRWDRSGPSLREAYHTLKAFGISPPPSFPYTPDEINAAWEKVIECPPPESFDPDRYIYFVDEMLDRSDFPIADPITAPEVANAICKLQTFKSPGLDQIPNEVWKTLPMDAYDELAANLTCILQDPHVMPPSWKESDVALLPKQDNPSPLDFRPITLLQSSAKLLEIIVWIRIKELMYNDLESTGGTFIPFEQGGFVLERGTMEQSWILEISNQYYRRKKKPLFVAFLDIKKAYDSCPFSMIMCKLLNHEPLRPYCRYINHWIRGHRRRLRVPGNDRTLKVLRGVPQGSILAPFIFDIFMNDLIADLNNDLSISPVSLYDLTYKGLLYADDIALVAPDLKSLQKALDVCHSWSLRCGMEFAPHKSKILRLGHGSASFKASLGGVPLEYVREFKYLGINTRDDSRRRYLHKTKEADSALASLNRVAGLLQKRARCPPNVLSLILSGSYLPAMFYGCEVFDIEPRSLKKVHTKIAKRSLQVYDTSSTTSVLEFLGWETPEYVQFRRCANFVARLLSSKYSFLKDLVTAVFNDSHPKRLYWHEKALLSIHHCTTEVDIFEAPKQFLNRNIKRKVAHPVLLHNAPHAFATFMFLQSDFNPRDRPNQSCPLCGAGRDNAAHLRVCPHPESVSLRDAFLKTTSSFTSDADSALDQLFSPISPYSHLNGVFLLPKKKKELLGEIDAKYIDWTLLSNFHNAFWSLRVRHRNNCSQ
jgi:hypothetical protein